jgi:hypothetical protein
VFTQRFNWRNLVATFLIAATCSTFILSAAQSPETKSALETDGQGWTDILPAPDLKGWFRVAVPANARLGRDQWHVDGTVLVCDGDGGHDMLL